MPVQTVRHPQLKKSAYEQLLKQVRQTLLLGRRRIEAEKVRTYWQTGKLIHEHLLQHKERADYGNHVIQKLAEDLEINHSVIHRTLRFYRNFPDILARGPKLGWSHYRALITVPDETQRRTLADLAARKEWTAEQLRQKIQMEVGDDRMMVRSEDAPEYNIKKRNGKPPSAADLKLTPKLGKLYTYRLLKPETINKTKEGMRQRATTQKSAAALGSQGQVWLDLGFNNHTLLPNVKGFREGLIVEASMDENGHYEIKASDRSEKDLYTYKAVVERVVDGDTFIFLIDQGFSYRTRHYLRLRGINCPELGTPEGARAKAFIERELAKVPHIILTSTRSDKYGRYLADVHMPLEIRQTKFLNQILLDEQIAVKV